jgi:GTP-binding protein YchF
MRAGFVGLPQSGKTTVFQALTAAHGRALGPFKPTEPHIAVIKVPDARVDVLAQLYRPRKTTHAEIEFVDLPGTAVGGSKEETARLATLRTMDMLLYVVRAFQNETVPHEGPIDPAADLARVHADLILADLQVAENRIQRLQEGLRRARPQEREVQERELALLQRIHTALEHGTPVRDLDLDPDEEKLIRGFQFLTLKPALVVVNIDERQLSRQDELLAAVEPYTRHRRTGATAMAARFEYELTELEPEEARAFMEDAGLAEPAARRIIPLCVTLLGLVSFFTVSPEEVRAWPVPAGTLAPQAAGAVHSDMERGFIRAEVVPYDDLVRLGSMAEARRHGLVRQEGRSYAVQDGDVIYFLFSR